MANNIMDVADYRRLTAPAKSKSKYKNEKVEADGRLFDSKKEAGVYLKLKYLMMGGKIEGFECQKPYPIVFNGVKICTYRADFVVRYNDGRTEVWDAKGFRTPVYRLKKKMLKAFFGIEIIEV